MDFQSLEIRPLIAHLKAKFDESEPQKAKVVPAPSSKTRKAYDQAQALLTEFLEFAQAYLDKFQPMNTLMLERGFGCTLQDGQPVCLCRASMPQPMRDEGIGITQGPSMTTLQPSGAVSFGSR